MIPDKGVSYQDKFKLERNYLDDTLKFTGLLFAIQLLVYTCYTKFNKNSLIWEMKHVDRHNFSIVR
jgi:hypothetical protein